MHISATPDHERRRFAVNDERRLICNYFDPGQVVQIERDAPDSFVVVRDEELVLLCSVRPNVVAPGTELKPFVRAARHLPERSPNGWNRILASIWTDAKILDVHEAALPCRTDLARKLY